MSGNTYTVFDTSGENVNPQLLAHELHHVKAHLDASKKEPPQKNTPEWRESIEDAANEFAYWVIRDCTDVHGNGGTTMDPMDPKILDRRTQIALAFAFAALPGSIFY